MLNRCGFTSIVPLHSVKGASAVLNMIFIVFVSLPALFFSQYNVAY